MNRLCSNCPVWVGECPDCGTFWISATAYGGVEGKRYGIRPVDSNPVILSGRKTTAPGRLDTLINVTTTHKDTR